MSAGLTVLFLCDHTEVHSPLISALQAAGFQLLIGHNPDAAKAVLLRQRADAIMIRHTAVQDGTLVGIELKLLAPRTPIILFPCNHRCQGTQLGIDSICHADPQDESVARAVAVFFQLALSAQAPHPSTRALSGTRDSLPRSGSWQLAL